jgi:hypothetical protein
VIPGQGEDVDGDGLQDARTTVQDLRLPGVDAASAPTSFGVSDTQYGGQRVLDAQWLGAGRLPGYSTTSGGSRYKDVATSASHLDAVLYSNHFVVGSMAGGGTTTLNGAIVARNECLYASSRFAINHDARVLGGGTPYNFYLPRDWQPPKVLYVKTLTGAE